MKTMVLCRDGWRVGEREGWGRRGRDLAHEGGGVGGAGGEDEHPDVDDEALVVARLADPYPDRAPRLRARVGPWESGGGGIGGEFTSNHHSSPTTSVGPGPLTTSEQYMVRGH